jgi:perosamine synthetase
MTVSSRVSPAEPRTSIPITRPTFGAAERAALQLPLESGWVVQGPHVAEFERSFCEFTGAGHAVATTSCTTALHVAVAVLGLGPGDEVIVPAFTWVSTANVVEYMGATPRFVDIDLETFNTSAAHVAPAVNERSAGILPVHLFGLCADMDPIVGIASRGSLWIIEDAACGFGATYNGRHAGTLGDIAGFSFHPRKSITTGEGGMLTTDRGEHAALARSLRDHGASRTDLERHAGRRAFMLADYPHLGYNYRMTDFQGALGCAQLERGHWILEQRARSAAMYTQMLAGVEWLQTPKTPPGFIHGWQAYVCLFRPDEPTLANVGQLNKRRNGVMERLEQAGIAVRPGTHAPVNTDYYASKYQLRPEDFPGAYFAEQLSLALPLYPDLTDADQERVVDGLIRAFETA